MRKALCFLCLVPFLLCVGCASIVSKSQYPVTINSSPGEATVTVKNKSGMEIHKAITPTTVTLSASAGFFSPASYTVDFRKEGYYSSSASMAATVDGWYIANILFGGLIGWIIVDPATGAMWKLDETIVGSLSVDPTYEAKKDIPIVPVKALRETPVSDSEDVANQLKKLKELKDSGILTDDEYETRRRNLIDRL
ncbi:MAG: SHOCT domain-containing protein [Peptococcia bacterium]|nr:SHOCT domain-containing protein [Syntrophobacterales bacterium]